MSQETEVTLGEVARGLSRVEREMQVGFAAIRAEIQGLSFVPAAVYAADMLAHRERLDRIEREAAEETEIRREAEATAQQRAWQARWSIILAVVAMPISVLGSVVAALLIAALK